MILLDTHTWIWWSIQPERLSNGARSRINAEEEGIGISVISCWEVSMLVAKGRVGFTMELGEWIETTLKLPLSKLLELTPLIAVSSNRLTAAPPKDPVDRILIATAQAHHCPIVTRDRQILGYPHVQSIW